jgi:hypothetical protein
MHHLPEANIIRARHKPRLNDLTIGFKSELQSGWIGLAANKTAACVWQSSHAANRRHRWLGRKQIEEAGANGLCYALTIASYAMQSTTNIPPPNGTTTNNTTTNLDGVLPFGEVFFRSAVIDPLRGFAYLGQDSRPNQVVKAQLARADSFNIARIRPQAGAFQFGFSNILGFRIGGGGEEGVVLGILGGEGGVVGGFVIFVCSANYLITRRDFLLS